MLQVILPTPMTDMLHLLRRCARGAQGYVVVRSVPIVVQVPVLHCTGSVMQKLVFFFWSEQGQISKVIAKLGMCGVTGRSNQGSLYMREHIKFVALILSCPDIVGVPIDSAVLSMWSLAVLMTAAWRQARTAPMNKRVQAVAVMELAAGLLAHLWSALKPLDKERKTAGVMSLYLHATLVHARDSLGDNSPAKAVITDNHVEGRVHDMGKHHKARVTNVARAQAVTELPARADDTEECRSRSGFRADLQVHTERLEVCGCCRADLGETQAMDLAKAVERTGKRGCVAEEEEDSAAFSFLMPVALLHDQKALDDAAAEQPWLSKESKVARTLSQRLRTLHVCLCGAATQMEAGPLVLRLRHLSNADGVAHAPGEADDAAAEGDAGAGDAEAVRASAHAGGAAAGGPTPQRPNGLQPGVAADESGLTPNDTRCMMVRHTLEYLHHNDGTCDGICAEEEDAALDPKKTTPAPEVRQTREANSRTDISMFMAAPTGRPCTRRNVIYWTRTSTARLS